MQKISNYANSRLRGIQNRLLRSLNKTSYEEDFLTTLPPNLHSPANLVFSRQQTPEEKQLAAKIEQFRSTIATNSENKQIPSYSSPKSGNYETSEDGHIVPGPYVMADVEAHAKTGTGKHNGILLRRLVESLKAKTVLELGTNTGFSGCYFLSSPVLDELVTIEGSAELCEIAETNMGRISNKFRLLNMLFDEALDLLTEENAKFDMVFIDGQHEREASKHYVERTIPLLNPKGTIVLDDIYWSADMNQFWKDFCRLSELSITVDLQTRGIGILRTGDEQQIHYDICDYIGRPRIYHKGW